MKKNNILFFITSWFFLILLSNSFAKGLPFSLSLEKEAIEEKNIPSTEILSTVTTSNTTLILKKDGTVWGWGKNNYGQLGVGVTSETVPLPVQTTTGPLQEVASLQCDGKTTVAIRHDGTIWKSSEDFLIAPWLTRGGREISQQFKSGGSPQGEEDQENFLLQKPGESLAGLSLLAVSNPFLEQEPWEAALQTPEEPFAISLVATGPYRAPANIELVASVTHPANSTIAKVEFYNKKILLATVTDPPYEFAYKDVSQGTYHIQAKAYDGEGSITSATTEFEVAPPNRYNRGFGSDQRYLSSIIALDFEKVTPLDGVSDFSTLFPTNTYPNYPWFLRAASDVKEPCYHIDHNEKETISYHAVNTIPTANGSAIGGQPPFIAFGVQGGGSPLYVNQNYHLGIAAGGQNFALTNNPDIKIEVYEATSFEKGATQVAPVCIQTYSLPRPGTTMGQLTSNGGVIDYHLLTNYNGKEIDFDSQVQYIAFSSPHDQWGEVKPYPYVLTHKAGNNLFYYKVNIMGVTANDSGLIDLAKNEQQSAPAYNLSYSLDFSEPPPWQLSLINLPHFQSTPLPSAYQGKSVDELIHQSTAVRDTLSSPEQLGLNLTAINNSPELKSHSVLDQLVADYNNDPLALANYVLNEIELTDAIGYNSANSISDASINPQGVSRDALGTYLEGQGSPIEQCGLLIYLLRKAGVPAAYVFPAHNQTLMFDEQLSKLLRVQLRGAVDDLGNQKYPELIPINYPWVTAYMDGKWVHLFPWLKDTEVKEGGDLWNYFPKGYQTETQWLMHYLLNDPTIRGLSQEDNPGTLFPLYAEKQLNQAGLSLEDMGMHYVNRPHYYHNWDDFPRPWQTSPISNSDLAQNLDAAQNPNLATVLTNIFDTINIQITSTTPNSNFLLETGPMRFADLHNRRLLLYSQLIPGNSPAKFKMILSLESYDNTNPSDKGQTYTFTKGDNSAPAEDLLRSAQQQSALLADNDNVFNYKISYSRQQQAGIIDVERDYTAQFPGIANRISNDLVRPIAKGEMACLSLSYGRVTDKMLDFEAKKYWDYQKEAAATSESIIDPERGVGQLLQLVGQNYYYNLSQFKSVIELLTKKKAISYLGQGLVKLIPERNFNRSLKIINTNSISDLNLAYPVVDMATQRATYLRNNTSHLDSGTIAQDIEVLFTVDGSANEHGVINKFFEQENAVSTVRLLDIAQGWTPETGIAAHPGEGVVILSQANAMSASTNSYTSAPGTFIYPPGLSGGINSLTTSLGGWIANSGFLESINNTLQNPFSIVILTPAPVKTADKNGDPYIGMAALTLGEGGIGALISRKMLLTFDQNFNYIIANSNQNSLLEDLKNNLLCDNTTFFHGGFGEPLKVPIYPGHLTAVWLSQCSLTKNNYNGYTLNFLNKDQPLITSNPDPKNLEQGTEALSPDGVDRLSQWNQNSLNNTSTPIKNNGSDTAALLRKEKSLGNIGSNAYYGKLLNFVHDPVSVVTGEFYINALDLELKGPMPLELRRTYSSQNLAENNLGSGWKMGAFHYLMLSADGNESTPPSLIYAAESDGSVVAYRYQKEQNTWIPQPGDNPNLINANDGTLQPSHNLIPPSRNLFNNRITKTTSSTQSTSNSIETYTLSASDGSTRTFTVRSFPLSNTPDITRTRPYLDTWQDPQGNSLSFAYGTNNKASSWGELTSIIASNGNTLHFSYDAQGHITEAFGSDGRHLTYQYDNFGDLIKVTLPDNSVVAYQYAHTTTSGKTTSTHLLTQQTKPGGRILKNDCDAQRRVIAQYASGSSPKPSLSATFDYNSTGSNGVISGNSTVTDALGNRTDYLYDNNQITNILYPANGSGIRPSISRQWTSGGTYKAMAQETNRQGLSKNYRYDGAGNLTSLSESGTLTGESSGGNETATTTFTYNTNNLLTSVTDPLGNKTIYEYSGYNLTSIRQTALGKIRSTQLTYQENQGAHGLISSINKGGATTTFTYNSKGFLTSRTEQTGTQDPALTETISCDGRGNIIQSINSLGEKKTYDYDMMDRPIFEETFDATGSPIDWHSCYYNGNGEITWEQGARFNPVNYTTLEYDWSGKVTHKGTWQSKALPDGSGITSAGIAATSYGYDGQGNMTSMTDPNGNVISMTYDANGNMLSRSKGGATETFSYDTGGNITAHTTLLGGTEQNSITSRGQVASITAANGTTTSYRYDLIGRLTQTIFPNGTQEKIAYDDGANKRTTTLCDNNGTTLSAKTETFDNQGNCISWTDEAGNLFQASYDGLGRIVTFQGPPGGPSSAQQTKTYHYGINSTTSVNALGEWKITYVDALKRPLATFAFNSDGSLALKESRWYSADHQSVTTWQGEGNATSVTTDLQGHPLIISNADGSCKVMTYDANGNPTSTTDEEGNVTTFTYDALNHLTSQTLPGGGMIAYSYNPLGELLSRSLPGGVTEKNDYNEAGEKIADAIVGSDGSTTAHHTYSYTQGRISSVNDPRGFTTTLGYDGVGRTVSVISNGSPTSAQNQRSAYTYDPRGLLSSVAQYYADPSTGPSTLVSRAYDAYGQLISESTSINGAPHSSWKQSWDGRGRRVALNWTLDNQSPVAQYSFNYNALGLMTQAGNGSGTCSYGYGQDGLLLSRSTPFGATTMTRDHCGRVLQQKLPTGAQESLSWRGDGRLSSYSMADPSGALISETRNYAYDGRGRVLQEPFTSKEKGTQLASYEFDPLNTRMRQEVDGDIAAAVVGQNGFAQVISDNFPTTEDHLLESSYDAAGNVTAYGNDLLTSDSFGRLVGVSQGNGNNWSTTYDGLGRRLQTVAGGNTINYYYDPEVKFLELGHSLGGNKTWNLYGPDRSGIYGGAEGIGGLELLSENGLNIYGALNNYFGDLVGKIISGGVLSNGSVLGGYGPMPGSKVAQGLTPEWRGKYQDSTGFYYLGARYYNPASGRFLSADPLGPDASLSLYDYCNGDPVNGLDPDGRCAEGMVTGQAYNIPSYSGALMGRMMPGFSTTQQIYSTIQTYDANYETFGESHWNAINTTFNPAYAMIKGGYEATTGFGMSPNNLGQDLSVRQRIGAGVESAIGVFGTVGIAFGRASLGTAGKLVAAETTATRAMWVGPEGELAAKASGAQVLQPSSAAVQAASSGDWSLMRSESAAWAKGATGTVPVFFGNGKGRIFLNDELPELLKNMNSGKVNAIDITF